MNHLKFQQDTLKELIVGNADRRVVWCTYSTDQVAVCLNKFVVVIMNREDVRLDLSKIEEMAGLKDIVTRAVRSALTDNLLKPTDEYRLFTRNRKARIYNGRAWRTAIDQDLLKYFDSATMKLYQLEENGAILVTEKTTRGFEEAVGVVLPINLKAKN